MTNDNIQLIDGPDVHEASAEPWKILVIDDEQQMHEVTRLALDGFRFDGRTVQLHSAHSAHAAKAILQDNPDFALILLDVVMESEHAGLDLVHFIRKQMRNVMVRIVLRTGQPGRAPPLEVIQQYDIDDYRTKTELTFDRFYVVVTAALRTFQLLHRMDQSQKQMSYLANHDALTGLPNRALLKDRIAQALAQAARNKTQFAILFIDIDGFKYINDSFGHTFGDTLLQVISTRLKAMIRSGDTIARLGGDEFIVVLTDVAAPTDAIETADKLLHALCLPLQVDERTILVSASIGLSFYPQDGDNTEHLLKNADIALYAAKQAGRSCVQVFKKEMSDRANERVELESALRQALDLGQFELHYQPKMEISTRKISGVEALIRWNHPELGTVSPLRFVRLAEETGLILPIGQWVLKTACQQLKLWHDAGHPGFTVAVNISACQLQQQDLVKLVQDTIKDTGIPAHTLELELTESALIGNSEKVIDILNDLKQLGITISLDDFGTGYSSLSYLNRFPIDTIKIDQSFTSRLTTNLEAASITRAIIVLAQSLNKRTIAEGVETAEQLFFLTANACDAIQGYYLSRPIPADQFTSMLGKTPVLGAAAA